jgi:integrase
MAQTKCPWTVRKPPGNKNYHVRFSHLGQRFEPSTGTSDPVEAKKRAPEIYADVISGRRKVRQAIASNPAAQIDQLGASWLAAIEHTIDPKTFETYLVYVRHFNTFFRTLGNVSSATVAQYGPHRLGHALRPTVKKEQSALRGFLGWCKTQAHLSEAPVVPPLPKKAVGTPFKLRRRQAATQLEPAEILAILERLPEWSESKKVKRFPIRARFVLQYEQGMRPEMLDVLEVPKHYTKGSSLLKIETGGDKNRWERELPLTDKARAALDSVCPKKGVIFGVHDYRDALRKAAKGVLPKEKAERITAEDLRHSRLTEWAETGNLPGAAYLAGHTRISTIDKYAKPGRRAAERLLGLNGTRRDVRIGGGAGGLSIPAVSPPLAQTRTAGPRAAIRPSFFGECEGGDSNPHRNYPTSTSSYCGTPQCWRMAPSRRSRSIGFFMISTPLGAREGSEVDTITGTLESRGSSCILARSSLPVRTGMMRSRTTTHGRVGPARYRSASAPFAAIDTS